MSPIVHQRHIFYATKPFHAFAMHEHIFEIIGTFISAQATSSSREARTRLLYFEGERLSTNPQKVPASHHQLSVTQKVTRHERGSMCKSTFHFFLDVGNAGYHRILSSSAWSSACASLSSTLAVHRRIHGHAALIFGERRRFCAKSGVTETTEIDGKRVNHHDVLYG